MIQNFDNYDPKKDPMNVEEVIPDLAIDIAEAISMSNQVLVLSKRPCTIKNIYNINLTNQSTPIENRKAKEFASLYNDIWRDLDVQD